MRTIRGLAILSVLISAPAFAQSYIDLPYVLANLMSTSGTANQCWGMDPSGAFQEWITPAGGGGGISALTGDVTASGTGSVAATVASVGGKTAAAIATVVGNTSGTNTGDQTITLTGPIMGSGTGSFATSIASQTGTGTTFVTSAGPTITGTLTTTTQNVNGASGPGAMNIKPTGTTLTSQLNLPSASATFVYSFHTRDAGNLFIWDGSNIVMDFLNGQMGVGASNPAYQLDVNRADSNTTQTSPGVVTVVAIHNTNSTAGNISTLGFVDSVPAIDAAIEGIHSTNSASYAGKLEFLTSTGGTLAVHEEMTTTGQINYKGTAPTIASAACGTLLTGTVVGNDVAGRITVGTGGANPCTLTFNTSWTNTPICMAVDETAALLLKVTPAVGSLVITGAMSAGDNVGYHCYGYL